MFERFTEDARRVIFFARYEASHRGHARIGPEHLLLGILRQDKTQPSRFVPEPSLESIREQIEQHFTPGPPASISIDLPISSECKMALALAAEEGGRRTGLGHLLLGLLLEEKSFAATALREQGFSTQSMRDTLLRNGESRA
jgi:ATP-dependent Clp protease ATP-binding subunit ClpC